MEAHGTHEGASLEETHTYLVVAWDSWEIQMEPWGWHVLGETVQGEASLVAAGVVAIPRPRGPALECPKPWASCWSGCI